MRGARFGRPAALLLSVALLVGACSGTEDSDDNGPSASQTPTPSTKEYNQALSSVTSPLNKGLSELRSAKDLDTLSKSVVKNKGVVDDAATWLKKFTPPPRGKKAHAQLVSEYERLGNAFEQLQTAITKGEVCAVSSALAEFGQKQAVRRLPKLQQTFTSRGYTLDIQLPKLPEVQNRRLDNATFVKEGERDGSGQLTIDNSTDSDAVITLSKGKTSDFAIYVRAKDKVVVKNINDGEYRIYSTSGSDWDSDSTSFTRECVSQRFDDTSVFRTDSTSFSSNSLTLQPSENGNTSATTVPPSKVPG